MTWENAELAEWWGSSFEQIMKSYGIYDYPEYLPIEYINLKAYPDDF